MNDTLHEAIFKTKPTGMIRKFWVGPGNNSAVVKGVLKQRYWW